MEYIKIVQLKNLIHDARELQRDSKKQISLKMY